jgi:hypothetical protein
MFWWLAGFAAYCACAMLFYVGLVATARPEPGQEAEAFRVPAEGWRRAA